MSARGIAFADHLLDQVVERHQELRPQVGIQGHRGDALGDITGNRPQCLCVRHIRRPGRDKYTGVDIRLEY